MSDKKKTDIHIDADSLRTLASRGLGLLSRYGALLFFLLVSAVYGFVILRINLLGSVQPTQSDIDAQTTATPVPRIDPKVATQLQQLEDNSVNVQTLFNQARNNPFQ